MRLQITYGMKSEIANGLVRALTKVRRGNGRGKYIKQGHFRPSLGSNYSLDILVDIELIPSNPIR